MLNVCTWLWGDRYRAEDVHKLRDSVARNLKQRHRFFVVTDAPEEFPGTETVWIKREDYSLLAIKGCFARLRMFDPIWQMENSIYQPLLCIDVDTVVTGELDPLVDRQEDFVILSGGNASNPCPFNGALLLLRPGTNHHLWRSFSIDNIMNIPHYEFPDDQGWYAQQVPNAGIWKAGPSSGVYVYGKPGWPKGSEELPHGARAVTFIGRKEPRVFQHLEWVRENWATDDELQRRK
jgi:hypothetical protein